MKNLNIIFNIKISKINFKEFQNNIYNSFFEKDKNRDYFLNTLWYLEELIELLLELYNLLNLNILKENNFKENNLKNLIIELSDTLAWIFSILNLNKIKINEIYIFDSSLDNLKFFIYNLLYSNLYLIKAIKKKDLKNIKNQAYLIIFYIIKISYFFKIEVELLFNRYKVCPKCNNNKCIC